MKMIPGVAALINFVVGVRAGGQRVLLWTRVEPSLGFLDGTANFEGLLLFTIKTRAQLTRNISLLSLYCLLTSSPSGH